MSIMGWFTGRLRDGGGIEEMLGDKWVNGKGESKVEGEEMLSREF